MTLKAIKFRIFGPKLALVFYILFSVGFFLPACVNLIVVPSALDRAEDEIQTLILRRDAMGEEKSNIRHKISQINNYIEVSVMKLLNLHHKFCENKRPNVI